MNDSFRDALPDPVPAAPRKAGLFAPLAKLILGPNEDLQLKPFIPYLPAVNLIPARKPPSVSMLLGLSGAIATASLALACLAFSFQIQALETQIQTTETLAAKRKLEQRNYTSVQTMLDMITAQKDALERVAHGAPRWATILESLRELTPADLRYKRLKGDASGNLYIQGHAEDLKTLGKFMVNLRGSGTFYRPSLGMGLRQEVRGKSVVSYDLRTGVLTTDWLASPEFQATRSAETRAAQ